MDNSQKAYLAGIIDGEGNIEFSKRNYIRVRVKMSSYETISYLKKITNLGCIYKYDPRIRPEKNHYKMLYTWQVSFNQALFVLNEVLPFLITKKIETLKVLELDSSHKRKLLKRGFYKPH